MKCTRAEFAEFLKSDAIRFFVKEAIEMQASAINDAFGCEPEEHARIKRATGVDFETYRFLTASFAKVVAGGSSITPRVEYSITTDTGVTIRVSGKKEAVESLWLVARGNAAIVEARPAEEFPAAKPVDGAAHLRPPEEMTDCSIIPVQAGVPTDPDVAVATVPMKRGRPATGRTPKPPKEPRSPLRVCRVCAKEIHFRGMRTHLGKHARESVEAEPADPIDDMAPPHDSLSVQEEMAPGVLRASMRRSTPEAISVQCLECGDRFPDARTLGAHRTRIHFTEFSINGSTLARAM